MRIIAGRWRGRRIAAPPGSDVRPTLDRVREAWMSIVQLELPGARVLDLFSGSGALGLEALSRGAVETHFVERDARAFAALKANAEALGAGVAAVLHRKDAIDFLKSAGEEEFDLAFADPPYKSAHPQALAKRWLDAPFAKVLGIEHDSHDKLPGDPDIRRYGTTAISFFGMK